MNSNHGRLGDYMTSRRQKGEEGLPTLSVTLNDGLVRRDSLERKTETNLDPKQHLRVLPGDIAYNMMRMWQGASGLADEEALVSPAYVVLAPRKNLDPRFAAYLFKTARMVHNFWAYSYGLTNDRLRLYPNDALKVPVDIPSLPEQRKIADILSTWDAAIEKTEALLATAKAQKRALMQSLLTGKRRFPAFEGQPWKEVRLGSLGKCIRGVSYKPDQILDSETPETFRLYRSMNIQGGEIVEEPYVIVPKSVVTDERVLIPGDLAVCMSNGSKLLVGKSAPIRHTGGSHTVGAFCAIFRTHEADLQDFVRVLFQSPLFERHITVALAGSSINNLKNSDVEGMRFAVPSSRTEMIEIASVMNSADIEIVALLRQINKLRTEKKALMQQLLTGKRRVVV